MQPDNQQAILFRQVAVPAGRKQIANAVSTTFADRHDVVSTGGRFGSAVGAKAPVSVEHAAPVLLGDHPDVASGQPDPSTLGGSVATSGIGLVPGLPPCLTPLRVLDHPSPSAMDDCGSVPLVVDGLAGADFLRVPLHVGLLPSTSLIGMGRRVGPGARPGAALAVVAQSVRTAFARVEVRLGLLGAATSAHLQWAGSSCC